MKHTEFNSLIDLLQPYTPECMQSWIYNRHFIGFTTAFIASLGTLLGGLIVILMVYSMGSTQVHQKASKMIGIFQALSAGVMVYMTFLDLIPESTEEIGSKQSMIWFFIGVGLFLAFDMFLAEDEPDLSSPTSSSSSSVSATIFEQSLEKKSLENSKESSKSSKNHTTTAVLPQDTPKRRSKRLEQKESSVSKTFENSSSPFKFSEKKSLATSKPTSASGNTSSSSSPLSQSRKTELIRASIITYAAMTLHNLPEGLGVYLSTLSNLRLGLQLALGIMLHNIPEGMAVAIPLWAATGSPIYVLWMTLLNGLAEPLGVAIGGWLLKPYLSQAVLSKCLAAVGGIMAYISFSELMPMAIKFSNKDIAVKAFFLGMLVCFIALESVDHLLDGLDIKL